MSDPMLLSLSNDHSDPAARGDWATAERVYDEARATAARAGDDVALAVALTNRGQALARLGRLEEAALALDAALAVRRRHIPRLPWESGGGRLGSSGVLAR